MSAIVVGTSFASSFFLLEWLKHAEPTARVLVLERGPKRSYEQMLAERKHAELDDDALFINRHPSKRWVSNVVFGGNSSCWWACTPRFLPSDFELRSRYGVGEDWPVGYSELEPYYVEVEQAMQVSGPDYNGHLFERSAPYPQPPHRLSAPDRLLQAAYPSSFFAQPTARARKGTATRPACCASNYCGLCPIRAKFTIPYDLAWLYQDPRIELRVDCEVTQVDLEAGRARGVVARIAGREQRIAADLVVLGANALFNPAILLRSGDAHPYLGACLNEQLGLPGLLWLDGVECFDGSTSITGQGYMLYDGEHRREQAAALIEIHNAPALRIEPGRWRERLFFRVVIEDLPERRNRVVLGENDLPELHYEGHSSYAQRCIDSLRARLEDVFSVLPVERMRLDLTPDATESHILGTTRMGHDPESSVIDANLVHHRYRNLLVLGGGAFPTSSPANPTLTLSALSLRAGRKLFA